MKKSSIVAISVMGTVGGLLLAIGMCMCLLPEWNAFVPGVVLAVIGAITLLAIWPVSRKASGKALVHITGGYVAATLLGLIGAVALGIGLVNCLQTVTVFGLAVGIVGLIFILAAVLVGRRAAGKAAISFNGKLVLAYVIGIAGALILGVGMCLTMVFSKMLLGIVICLVGIVVLLMLIPLTKGVR